MSHPKSSNDLARLKRADDGINIPVVVSRFGMRLPPQVARVVASPLLPNAFIPVFQLLSQRERASLPTSDVPDSVVRVSRIVHS